MAATPTAGGKYILTFSLEGSGEKQLNSIVKSFESIATQAGRGGAAGAVQEASRAVSKLGSEAIVTSVKVGALFAKLEIASRAVRGIERLGEGMRDVGAGILGTMVGVGQEVVTIVGELERSIMMLKVLGSMSNAQARDVQDQVNQLVAYTPFLTQQLMGLSEALVIGNVELSNWRDETGKVITLAGEAARGFSQMDEATVKMAGGVKVSALSVMADFAAITNNIGDKMPTFVRGMQRMMSTGSGRLLLDQVNAEARTVLMGAGASQKMVGTATETIQRMYAYLQRKNAVGMAAMASSTASGIMSNLAEIPLLIYKAIGGDPMDPKSPFVKIKMALAGMFSGIADIVNNPKWAMSMQKSFLPVIDMFAKAFAFLGEKVAATMIFFGEHPELTAWLLKIAAVSSIILMITGAFVGFISVLGFTAIGVIAFKASLAMTLPAITAFFVGLKAGILPFIATTAMAILPLVGLGVAVYATYRAFQRVLELSPSMRKTFSGFGAMFKGLGQIILNWSGSTTKITKGTARSLQEAGMLTPFLQLTRGIQVTREAFSGFWNSVKGGVADALVWFGSLGSDGSNDLEKIGKEIQNSEDDWSSFSKTLKLGFFAIVSAVTNVMLVLAEFNVAWAYTMGAGRVGLTGFVAVIQTALRAIGGLFTMLPGLGEALGQLASGQFTQAGITASHAWEQYKTQLAEPMDIVESIGMEDARKVLDAERWRDQLQRRLAAPVEGIVTDRPLGGVAPEGVMTTPLVPPTLASLPMAALESSVEREQALRSSFEQAMGPAEAPAPIQVQSRVTLEVDGRELASVVKNYTEDDDALNYSRPPG